MARFEFKLPDIGEGIAEAEIVAWHVKVGDQVAEDQQIADMMTDKATVEMESPVAGKVLEIAGEVGDQIAIGSVLIVLETEGEVSVADETEQPIADGMAEIPEALEDVAPVAAPIPAEDVPQDTTKPTDLPSAETARPAAASRLEPEPKSRLLASPAVRQRARDLGVDLAQVRYSGDRVRHADLDAYLLYHGGGGSRPAAPRQDEEIKVVGLRRRISENMQETKRRIPHFTYVDEVDVTALEQTRAMMNSDRGSQPKLTLLPFLITAMCKVLPDYPQINARYDDDAGIIRRSGAVHMGMATQTDNGLSVPVIRNAERQDVWQLATEILRLAEATRAGKASRDELSGSTITISSLGPMGGIVSTPVINRPEVAIIAVNKVKEMPVVVDGDLEIRKMMNLSLSCDHRVVDGWDAASFIQDLKKLLENPLRLLSMR
ncbi:MAG TPA: dihydrolipoamide acetyltransferase family protein [Allosphingosinicella sp.]|nr:dihydrolipoamide acetyltransferase family protein [Allosphingosinicella sp.]